MVLKADLLSFKSFDQIANVYLKNEQGVYLLCNDKEAEMAGVDNDKDMLGRTDFDVAWHESAELLRANDRFVATQKVPVIVPELVKLEGEEQAFTMLSAKLPCPVANDHETGVFGVSVYPEHIGLDTTLELIFSLVELLTPDNADGVKRYLDAFRKFPGLSKLSPRERVCVELAIQGKTAKETARILGISYRTVETHLRRAREKFESKNLTELVSKISR